MPRVHDPFDKLNLIVDVWFSLSLVDFFCCRHCQHYILHFSPHILFDGLTIPCHENWCGLSTGLFFDGGAPDLVCPWQNLTFEIS